MTAPWQDQPQKLPQIEALRALAVGMVMLQHAGDIWRQPQWLHAILRSGALAGGVDLFFVISGFVIARSLLPQLRGAAGQAACLGRFWLRRAYRLWPASWAVLLAVLAASLVLPADVLGSAAANGWAMLAGLLHYANFRFVQHFGGDFYGASFHYWSLSVEEQFYLVMPLLALLPRRLFIAIAAMFAAGEYVPGAYLAGQRWWLTAALIYHLVFSVFRFGTLFHGVLLAELQMRPSDRPARVRPLPAALPRGAGAALALLLLMLMPLANNGGIKLETMHGVVALLGSLLVWLASRDIGVLPRQGVLRAVLLWGGSRSYALYLVHVPVWLCLHALGRHLPAGLAGISLATRVLLFITGLAASAVLAEGCFRLIEAPMRAKGRRVAATHFPVPA